MGGTTPRAETEEMLQQFRAFAALEENHMAAHNSASVHGCGSRESNPFWLPQTPAQTEYTDTHENKDSLKQNSNK